MKILAFLLLTVSLTLASVLAAPLKIGYINIDHVVSSSPQFIEANQAVVAQFKPQEEKLLAFRKEIESLLIEFDNNKDDLSKEEIKSEVKKISALEAELKQKAIKLQQALQLKNSTELGKIEDLINQTIQEVAKEQEFDLILYQKVAYVSEKINITSIISERLRALFK